MPSAEADSSFHRPHPGLRCAASRAKCAGALRARSFHCLFWGDTES